MEKEIMRVTLLIKRNTLSSNRNKSKGDVTDWEIQFDLLFNEVLHRMVDLEILPNLQSKTNVRLDNLYKGGVTLYKSQDIKDFIRELLEKEREELIKKNKYRPMKTKKDKPQEKDYIVVKDYETAISLSKSKIPSLAGKYIIVAPKGLKFLSKEDIAKLPQVKQLRQDTIRETEKAYGRCHNCYGKGYATYRYGTRASADFIGEREHIGKQKTHMIFCECDRGKQLQALLK